MRGAGRAALAVLIVAGAGRAADPPGKAAAPVPADVAEGHAVFDKWCAPCHANSPRLAGTLALQTKYQGAMPAALEKRTDLTPEVVRYFVRNGVAWMAPFRKTEISDTELRAIGSYLSAKH